MRLGTLAGCFTRIDEIVVIDYWCIWILWLMWTCFFVRHQQWDNEHCWKAFSYTFRTNLRYRNLDHWKWRREINSLDFTSQVDLVESFLMRCGAKRSPQSQRCTKAVEMRPVVPRRDASMAMVDELQMVPLDGQKWEGMAFRKVYIEIV